MQQTSSGHLKFRPIEAWGGIKILRLPEHGRRIAHTQHAQGRVRHQFPVLISYVRSTRKLRWGSGNPRAFGDVFHGWTRQEALVSVNDVRLMCVSLVVGPGSLPLCVSVVSENEMSRIVRRWEELALRCDSPPGIATIASQQKKRNLGGEKMRSAIVGLTGSFKLSTRHPLPREIAWSCPCQRPSRNLPTLRSRGTTVPRPARHSGAPAGCSR